MSSRLKYLIQTTGKTIFRGFFLAYFLGNLALTFAQTVPDTVMYEGELFDSSNAPITTAHEIRISLWNNADFSAGDVDGAGAINTLAANYAGWTETHTFTPEFNGAFSVELGSNVAMPAVDFTTQKYLQIEIKVAGAANTAYEILDPTGDNLADTDDRQTLGSVLYAKNAERLQNTDIGTANGDLATLGLNGKWARSQIPDGTDEDQFIINDDGDDAILQFGQTLNGLLSFTELIRFFDFGANRLGNLLDPTSSQDATTKNYTDIHDGARNYDAARTYLEGDLTYFGGQTYRANTDIGTPEAFNATKWDSLAAAASSDFDGVVDQFTDLPAPAVGNNGMTYFVRNTEGGKAAGTYMSDGTTWNFQGISETVTTMSPDYENAIFAADGSDNAGTMLSEVLTVGTDENNVFVWRSREATIQDYDIQIRYEIPRNFQSFQSPALSLDYQTSHAATTESKLDFTVEKEGTAADVIAGSTGLNLANTAFTTTTFALDAGTTWTAGDIMILKVKLSSRNLEEARVGDIRIFTVE